MSNPRDPRSGRPVAPSMSRGGPVHPVDAEPVPLDLSALEPLDPEALEPLDPEGLDPLDPEGLDPLDPDALEPFDSLDPEALEPIDDAPVELGAEHLMPVDEAHAGEEAEPLPEDLDLDALLGIDHPIEGDDAEVKTDAGIDTSAYGGVIDEEPVDDTPPLAGLETTRLDADDGLDRRTRTQRKAEAQAAKGARAEFQYTTCPACQTPQPDPAPAFCESCGTRLRKPPKKGASEGATKRCLECGYRNRPDRSSCSNCGNRLPEAS